MFNKDVEAAIDALIAAKMPINVKWGEIRRVFADAKISYRIIAHTDQMLCHPCNRGGLGINGFRAHRNAAKVYRIGGDMQELHKAAAFELSSDPARKATQINCNIRWVNAADGLLAPINGSERFLTISCGHTTAWCRAVNARCRTPEQTLPQLSGGIDPEGIAHNDKQIGRMLKAGWEVEVFPASVEKRWPMLPAIGQQALNAGQNVAALTTELEAACVIADTAAQMQADNQTVDWEQCVEAAASSQPACSDYLDTIGEFVKKYGGGIGGAMIGFLDTFSRKFGADKKIGKDMFTAVTNCQFRSVVQTYPHIRNGALALNLVSEKVEDGTGKFLNPSDFENLKSKAKEASLDKAEEGLAAAWSRVTKLFASGELNADKGLNLYGRASVRCLMYLTKSGKRGFEKKEYVSLEQIFEWFESDLAGKIAPIELASEETSSSSKPNAGPVSLAEASSAKYLMTKGGFEQGKKFTNNKQHPGKVFELVEMTEKFAKLKQYTVFDDPIEVQTSCSDLPKLWSLFKGNVQVRIDGDIATHVEPPSAHRTDKARATVFLALDALAGDHKPDLEHFAFVLQPAEVLVITDKYSKKGALRLFPATSGIDKLSLKKSGVSSAASYDGTIIEIEGPSKPKEADRTKWAKEQMLLPYWWVTTTQKEEDATMEHVRVRHESVAFKVLQNCKGLKKNDKLMVYKAPAPAAVGAPTAEPTAAKKPRTT